MIALGLLVPLLAGCLEAPTEPCMATDCVPPIVPADLTAAFRWESCRGFVGRFMAPVDAVRAAVPEAFDLVDFNSATAGVMVRGERCDRAAGDASIHPNVAFVMVLVRVTPRDAAWTDRPSNLYVLDALVTDAPLARSLAAAGVRAQPATLQITKVVALDPTSMDLWEFQGETLRITAPIAGGPAGAGGEERTQLWFEGPGSFRRVQDDYGYTLEGPTLQPGVLTLQGSAPSSRLFPTGSVPWEAQAMGGIDEMWTGAPRAFTA